MVVVGLLAVTGSKTFRWGGRCQAFRPSSSVARRSTTIRRTHHRHSHNQHHHDDRDVPHLEINRGVPDLILPSHPGFPIRSVMAPMVAASDYPFRVFLRERCGVDLTFTQMLLAKRFNTDETFRRAHLDLGECTTAAGGGEGEGGFDAETLLPSQRECLGDPGDLPPPRKGPPSAAVGGGRPRPLIVQLAGDDPEGVVETALSIYEHTDGNLHGIDLNCGCPQGIARKGNYGAFLMDSDPERVAGVLRALRKALPDGVAVSAKIRLPPDDGDLVRDRIPRLVGSGDLSFLTIHGRTRAENKQTVGAVHADRIRLAIETARSIDPAFPVIANGGMEDRGDVQTILRTTGASAAMSSEGLLETPDLFLPSSPPSDPSIPAPEDRFRKQVGYARDYLDVCGRVGPPLPGVLGFNSGGSFNVVRGHLFKFLHRYLNHDHTDLRNDLAAPGKLRTLSDAHRLLDELESRYAGLSAERWDRLASTPEESSWYRRHRKPDRAAVHVRHDLTTTVGRERWSSSGSTVAATVADRKAAIRERLAAAKAARDGATTKRFV